MRVRRIFTALHVYPSDSARHSRIGAGMGGLRHKARHKIPARVAVMTQAARGGSELSSSAMPCSMETPFHPFDHHTFFIIFQGRINSGNRLPGRHWSRPARLRPANLERRLTPLAAKES